MSSSSTSSSRPNSTSSNNRDHNQGRQTRDYTPAQAEAVNRVRKCKHHEYYAILDIEKTATDGDIKRAYRKLALLMHPDKNGAPGADEAFKMVSKAFQILSDKDKKATFDATGTDPESRGGMPSGFSRGASANFNGMYADEISPDELFNMFFGGGGGTSFQTSFGGFGGPGIRIHSFGGSPFGGSPFGAFGRPMNPGTGQRRPPGGDGETNGETTFSPRMLIQLLPLILLFVVPLLSSLFESSSSSSSNIFQANTPFEFTPSPPYTVERITPKYRVQYYINPRDTVNLNDKRLRQLDQRAENSYVRILQNKCDLEYGIRQRKLEESQGWFFVDQDKYKEATNMKMESCDRLKSLGVLHNRR
ncbi:DnaJ domain-containing protein [Lipomyces kononenkoae]|uniref:DnaJ domain-containing protein n=1 Tax=Lipomyces kononenkoae TaxID=34357 RepID=A0ACC3T370_LIPKO